MDIGRFERPIRDFDQIEALSRAITFLNRLPVDKKLVRVDECRNTSRNGCVQDRTDHSLGQRDQIGRKNTIFVLTQTPDEFYFERRCGGRPRRKITPPRAARIAS
jgi:hypothetical protein